MKRKICVVTSGRADYLRFKTAMQEIEKNPDLELRLIVIGAHLLDKYGKTINDIINDGFTVHEKIYTIVEGENNLTMTKSVGLGIIELATTMNNYHPDIVFALTDRYEAFMTATSAALLSIPLAHVQGGEVTGTIDESIRHSCTKLANWHFTASEDARRRVIKLGEPEHTVFNTGCPSVDLLKSIPIMSRADFLRKLYSKTYTKELDTQNMVEGEPYILFMQHPVTTEGELNTDHMVESLQAIQKTGIRTILLWPNSDAGSAGMVQAIRYFMMENKNNKIMPYKHFSYDFFVNMMYHASCMVGNSSAAIRECPYVGTPVVNIGTRETGRERASNVVDATYDAGDIYKTITSQIAHGKYPVEEIFGDGTAGKKIADIVSTLDLSYVQKKITF